MIWLNYEQILYLHKEIIKATGGSDGVRDSGLLQSALVAPMQTYDNTELFPSITEKTARLAFGLTEFHPFVDGNKRIGAHAMLVVLELNGIHLQYTQKELGNLFLSLASSQTDYDTLLKWVREHKKGAVAS